MHVKEILRNVERGYPGLAKASRLPKGTVGALQGKLDQNLWITAPLSWFRSQLRWIMIRQQPHYFFKVSSDTELLRAWLGTVPLKGMQILDPDAYQVSMRYMNLEDLVEPPDLLIVHVGVKKARNEAAPEVLMETISHRAFRGKPTWVFNDARSPFDPSLPSFSYEVESTLNEWERIEVKAPRKSVSNPRGKMPSVDEIEEATSSSLDQPPSPSLPKRGRRGMSSGNTNQTKALELPEVSDNPRRKKRSSTWKGR